MMSSDTMYFNRSRMLHAHNKNNSHMSQARPFPIKKSKSTRRSLKMIDRRSERECKSLTPNPMEMKFLEIPKLQVLPNGQRPNFGNNNNNSHNNHHHSHHIPYNSHGSNDIHNTNNLNSSPYNTHSRKKSSGGGGKTCRGEKDSDNDKRNRNNKKDLRRKSDTTNTELTEDVTKQLKNLLIYENTKTNAPYNSVTGTKDINKQQNNSLPLATFMTSPIITVETIPPQLKIEENSILGKKPLFPSIQQTTHFVRTNTQQSQFNNKLSNDSNFIINQSKNNTALHPLSHTDTSTMNTNSCTPLPIINSMVNSPVIHQLTPFQISNNAVPSHPFGTNNTNYSISSVPLRVPLNVAPPPFVSQQSPLNGPNLFNPKDINISKNNVPLLSELIPYQYSENNSNKTDTINNLIRHNKNTNKKFSHSFAGASFAANIPQECNLPKPSFL